MVLAAFSWRETLRFKHIFQMKSPLMRLFIWCSSAFGFRKRKNIRSMCNTNDLICESFYHVGPFNIRNTIDFCFSSLFIHFSQELWTPLERLFTSCIFIIHSHHNRKGRWKCACHLQANDCQCSAQFQLCSSIADTYFQMWLCRRCRISIFSHFYFMFIFFECVQCVELLSVCRFMHWGHSK